MVCEAKNLEFDNFINNNNIKPKSNNLLYICYKCAASFKWHPIVIENIKRKYGELECDCCKGEW